MGEQKQEKKQEKKQRKNTIIWKALGGILGGILGVAVVVYLGFAVYFFHHFCFHTTINGIDISGCTIQEVNRMLDEMAGRYSLTIVGRDGSTDIIDGHDISLEVVAKEEIATMLDAQKAFLWPYYSVAGQNLECEKIIDYSHTQLTNLIPSLYCMSESMQVMPIPARVSDYDLEEGYTVLPAKEGTAIDKSTFRECLEDAIIGMQEELNLADAGCYIAPSREADDEKLIATAEAMNEYAKAAITYTLDGLDPFVLDASTFGEWLIADEDLNITVDEEKVREYVSEMARKYNTCYNAKNLMTSYGVPVTISKSKYGWKIDEEAEVAQLIDEISNGKSVKRDFNYEMTANSHGENDYGDSYVEINLTMQHLFLYKNGELIVESDFVSGNLSKGYDTPGGAYGVTYTQKNAVLRGADYATPVNYWMPFNGNIGMHDATWRSRFGGDIYKTSGSHGCINLPYSAAKTIYENIGTNYPVLCYFLDVTPQEEQVPVDPNAADPGATVPAVDESVEPLVGQDVAPVDPSVAQ